MGVGIWIVDQQREEKGQSWKSYFFIFIGRCFIYFDVFIRQYGVYFLVDGVCREEGQGYFGGCFDCQGCRVGFVEGSEFSYRKRWLNLSIGQVFVVYIGWEMFVFYFRGIFYFWGRWQGERGTIGKEKSKLFFYY